MTIETVPLKLPKKQWCTLSINPDHTVFPDEYSRHVLYITRIYFRYGEAEPELIGQCQYRSVTYLLSFGVAEATVGVGGRDVHV